MRERGREMESGREGERDVIPDLGHSLTVCAMVCSTPECWTLLDCTLAVVTLSGPSNCK